MATSKIHVLIVLGHVGRYFGDKQEVIQNRAVMLTETLNSSPPFGLYDRVIITGGREISCLSNAEQIFSLAYDRTNELGTERLEIQAKPCRNRIALVWAIDTARQRWPNEDISFHIITSKYAQRRIGVYIKEHIRQLIVLHDGLLSPRELYWRFIPERTEAKSVPWLNRIRERVKSYWDIWRPYPVSPLYIQR